MPLVSYELSNTFFSIKFELPVHACKQTSTSVPALIVLEHKTVQANAKRMDGLILCFLPNDSKQLCSYVVLSQRMPRLQLLKNQKAARSTQTLAYKTQKLRFHCSLASLQKCVLESVTSTHVSHHKHMSPLELSLEALTS